MKYLRKFGIAAVALLALGLAAFAAQPGTTGTNKQNQAMGLRVGVLECFNRTATALAGAATINGVSTTQPSACGTVTSESLTTLAGSDYTLTLTNNLIAATDIVFASVSNGSNTGGAPKVTLVTPGAGSVVIKVRNGQSSVDTSLNGTLKINFLVIKQSASDSD